LFSFVYLLFLFLLFFHPIFVIYEGFIFIFLFVLLFSFFGFGNMLFFLKFNFFVLLFFWFITILFVFKKIVFGLRYIAGSFFISFFVLIFEIIRDIFRPFALRVRLFINLIFGCLFIEAISILFYINNSIWLFYFFSIFECFVLLIQIYVLSSLVFLYLEE